ncbi:hypothetical protein EDB89DRAFT_1841697 [Lactarius sanguifluus]|nr:hypothetical protein EDB89DRAFT_1841697 [Lactarius sanguifluus]
MCPSTVPICYITPGAQHHPSPKKLAGLNQKKKEAELSMRRSAPVRSSSNAEGLGDDCEAMANVGAVHGAIGKVLAQWPQMFCILNLFRDWLHAEGAEMETDDASLPPPGERPIRVPINELQQAEQK